MNAIRRIARSVWMASGGRREVVNELKEDPAVADDGLIAFAFIGVVVSGLVTLEPLIALTAIIAAPLAALAASLVLRLVSRIARHPVTLAQTTAAVTLTSLPLLLIPIPVVGAPVGLGMWVLAGIVMLQRLTLARLDIAAVILLLSHALTIGTLMATGFAIQALA